MNHTLLHSVAFVLLTSALFGYDADTIALYDFKSAETNAVGEGTEIHNLVDATRFTGVNEMNGKDVNLTCYSAERPGKYIFERPARGETPVITDPQSIRFKIGGSGTSQRITFADLGTAVSSNDDWTVEFFFMCPTNSATYWGGFFDMNCGLLFNPSITVPQTEEQTNLLALAGTAQPLRLVIPKNEIYAYVCHASYHQCYYPASRYMGSGATFLDGRWHHYACVYKASTKRYVSYLDHDLDDAQVARETTNSVLTASKPLILGLNGFDGYISGLRVSKCARTSNQFLHASNDPEYIQEKVLHWRLDGTNGENVSTITNIYATANPFVGQYEGTLGHSANGTVDVGSGAPTPTYTNEIPNTVKRYVRSGKERLGENKGSVHNDIKQRTTEAYFLASSGLKCPAKGHFPIEAGDFTVEFFAKIDFAGWLEKTAGTKYSRFTIFGLTYDSYEYMSLVVSASEYNGHYYLSHSIAKQNGTVSYTSSYTADDFLAKGGWHHYAVVNDDAARKVRFYLDGTLIQTTTLSEPYQPYGRLIYRNYLFGCGGNNHPIQGEFDEIRIVRRALTPGEFLKWKNPDAGTAVFLR